MTLFLKRSLIATAWLSTIVSLYVAVVALEFYWNVPDWQPRWDVYGFLLVWWVFACAVLVSVLVALTTANPGRIFAFVVCAAFVALGLYIMPAEALKPGLLGRGSSSPPWYRIARAGLLALPGVCWTVQLLRRRAGAESIRSQQSEHPRSRLA